jgi:hypothetical protein
MTAATTPLQSKFGPIVADAAGTITVQEASDFLDYSRFLVCELLTASAGRVLVTDVLALKSFVAPSALDAAPAAKHARRRSAPLAPAEPVAARTSSSARSNEEGSRAEQPNTPVVSPDLAGIGATQHRASGLLGRLRVSPEQAR